MVPKVIIIKDQRSIKECFWMFQAKKKELRSNRGIKVDMNLVKIIKKKKSLNVLLVTPIENQKSNGSPTTRMEQFSKQSSKTKTGQRELSIHILMLTRKLI